METSLYKYCGTDGTIDGLYNRASGLDLRAFFQCQVEAVENKLHLKSSDLIFENMTSENLETVAEMFIYLNMCPVTLTWQASTDEQQWFKSWFILYHDLFKSKSLNHIILALNRVMKSYSPKDKDGNNRNKKFLLKSKICLHLDTKI